MFIWLLNYLLYSVLAVVETENDVDDIDDSGNSLNYDQDEQDYPDNAYEGNTSSTCILYGPVIIIKIIYSVVIKHFRV